MSPVVLPPTPRRLRLSGALAMGNALLVVPWYVISFLVANNRARWAIETEMGLLVGSTVSLVFLLLTLRSLIVGCYGFARADRLIALLIQANVILTCISMLSRLVPPLEEGSDVVGILLVVIIGGLQLLFGVRLLKLPTTLGGLLLPYCVLNMVTGVCFATVVLLPVGIVASAVSDVMLGTIFFTVSRAIDESPRIPAG